MTAEVKQHIEYRNLPGGSVEAVLTVTLPNGAQQRYTAITHPDEASAIQGDMIGAELLELGYVSGSFFKSLGKIVKKSVKTVGKAAKGIASSKVFALAAKGLAIASPVLGPFAGPALAASAGMVIAAKLAKAGVAAAAGAKNVAAALTKGAADAAAKLTKTPEGAASLLAAANKKRLGAEAIAAGKKPTPAQPRRAPAPKPSARTLPAPKPKPAVVKPAPQLAAPRPKAVVRPPQPMAAAQPAAVVRPAAVRPVAPAAAAAPSYPPMSEYDLIARARAGRVRSNTADLVSDGELLAAHRSGRIFWVS